MQIEPYQSPEIEKITPNPLSTIRGYPAEQIPASPAAAFDFHNLLDVVRRRWLWIITPIIMMLALGIYMTKSRLPLYQASASVDIREDTERQPGSEELPALKQIESSAQNRTVNSQVRLLRSSSLIKQAMAALPDDVQRTGFTYALDVTVEEPQEPGEAITVVVTASSPRGAAELANSLVAELIKNDLAESRRTETSALNYIQQELVAVKAKLRAARNAMVSFKVAHEVSGTDQVLDQSITELTQLRQEAAQSERSLAVSTNLQKMLADKLRTEHRVILSDETEEHNPLLDKLDAYIDDLETRRLELRAEFSPDSPEVTRIEEQIRAAQQRRANFPLTRASETKRSVNPVYQQLEQQYITVISDANTQKARLAALRREITRLHDKLTQSAPAEVQSAEMVTNVMLLQETYELLSKNYQTLQLNAASQISNVRLLSPAVENPAPTNQNLFRSIILSLALGILLAVGLTVMVEFLDHRIHSEHSLEQMVYQSPLAMIPQVQKSDVYLNHTGIETSPVLEQMRLLRSILSRVQREVGYRIIGITSPGAREGKSTTALNLAIAMALDGKRILLIDADLRRPSLHSVLGLSNSKGLTSVLNGQGSLEEVCQSTPISGVTLLPAGPAVANATELLNDSESHRIIKELSGNYDVVIIDTPPVAGYSDVLSLVPVLDGVLMVISAVQTNRSALQTALRNLQQVGAPLLGFVYNHANLSSQYYKYYYRYK